MALNGSNAGFSYYGSGADFPSFESYMGFSNYGNDTGSPFNDSFNPYSYNGFPQYGSANVFSIQFDDDNTIMSRSAYETYKDLIEQNYLNTAENNATEGNTTNAIKSTLEYFKENSTILCGFPGFCQMEAYMLCTNVTLRNCGHCSVNAANLLVFFCVLVGLLIVAGNSLVVWVCARQKPKDTFARIKLSLAVADLIIGVQVLFLFPYDIVWTLDSTSLQLQARQFALRGSAHAIIGGFFFLLSFTSSLYHLLYLGVQRLAAIRWPFIYRKQKSRHVTAALIVVWALALLSATVPVWFPDQLVFTYFHTLFAYFFAQKNFAQPDRAAVVCTLAFFYVLPLVLMTIVCTMMAFTAHRKFGSVSNSSLRSREKQQVSERRVYRVVILMQVGFLITQLPFVICYSLFYVKVLNCFTWSDPFLITFYMSILNSLVNVVVYSLADNKFRTGVRKLFGLKPATHSTPHASNDKRASNPILAKYKPPSTANTT